MIEAVNSVVSNAQFLRGSAEQQAGARAAVSETQIKVSDDISYPKAPYLSLIVSVDTDYDRAVLKVRDSDTGDVLRQYPSESALEAEQAAERISSPPVTVDTGESIAPEIGISTDLSPSTVGSDGSSQKINVAQAQQAAKALSTAAAAQTSQIAQSVNVTA